MQIMKDCFVHVMQTFSNIQQGTNTVHRIHQFYIYIYIYMHIYMCVCVCGGGWGVGGHVCAHLFMYVFISKNIYGRFTSIIDHI
jgi:hypothetical protein